MSIRLLLPLLLLATCTFAQTPATDYIKVNFLYGSKPLRPSKVTEPRYFGGLHGEHVTIQVGIGKKRSRFGHVFTAFYPQRIRKRMLRLAQENDYEVIKTEVRPTRRWERD